MQRCIWCKETNADKHIEHIIAEGLGCPDGFVLTDGAVCRRCNNNLGHLDQAVIDEFDMMAFIARVPRKRGRSPKIDNRGNMFGAWTESGPAIHLNIGRKPVNIRSGHVLAAPGKSKRNIKAILQRIGNVADVSFQYSVGEGSKFVRGIVKIGLSSLAFFQGPTAVLGDDFDAIRRFVIEGDGMRKILWMGAADSQIKNEVFPPLRHESDNYYAIRFRLYSAEFIVDLSPDMKLFPIFKENAFKLYGSTGWSWLPL